MLYRAVVLTSRLALLAVVACASGGDPAELDAPGAVDAVAGDADDEVDAPAADAPALDAPALDAAEPDAAAVDAAPDAVTDAAVDAATDAMTDAAIDGGVTTSGNTCAEAIDLTAAALMPGGTTVTGNLTGYTNNIQPASSCTGFTNDGPDAIYVLNLTAGRTINASVTGPWDSAIEIVQPCAMTPTCLAGQDNGDPEQVSHTTTAAGLYYVIVDSWDPGAFGPYTLTVTVL